MRYDAAMPNYLADLDRGLKHFAKMTPVYVERENYYRGNIAEAFGNARIRRALRGIIERYKLNFEAGVVDSLVRRVKVAGIGLTGEGSDVLEEVLEDIVDDNELGEDLDAWIKKAAYLGDYYVLVQEDDDDDGDGDVDSEILGKSPFTTAILYNAMNSRKIDFGVQMWSLPDKRIRANLYYDAETYQLISKKGSKGNKARDFVALLELDNETGQILEPSIPNLYGFPLFHLRVDSKPYGTPVHVNGYGPQDAITKLVSTHMGSVDFQGFPQRYALADIDTEADNAGEDFGNGYDAQYEATRRNSKLASGPGEVWWLEGIKSVGQFAVADAKTFLDSLSFYIRAMAKLTDTPLYEFDLEGNEPSGESRRRADGPINNHAEALRRSFSVTIVAMLEYALLIGGHADTNVEVSWAPAEIVTDTDGWTALESKVKNGIPLRQALLEAGYSQAQIQEWYPDGAPAVSIAMALALADAFQKIAQSSAQGIAGAEDAAAWFPELLTAARPEKALPPAPIVMAPPVDTKLEPVGPPPTLGD